MKSNPTFVSRTANTMLVLLMIVVVGGLLRVGGADEVGAAKTKAPAPTRAATNATLPVLPAVARPPAAQPQVGLPADSHLDKTPARKTKSLDLVKNGWTYNCIGCHKLLPARWQYDRPLNEHQDIKFDHGNNRFCLNCQHATNRNAFVDYGTALLGLMDDEFHQQICLLANWVGAERRDLLRLNRSRRPCNFLLPNNL